MPREQSSFLKKAIDVYKEGLPKIKLIFISFSQPPNNSYCLKAVSFFVGLVGSLKFSAKKI